MCTEQTSIMYGENDVSNIRIKNKDAVLVYITMNSCKRQSHRIVRFAKPSHTGPYDSLSPSHTGSYDSLSPSHTGSYDSLSPSHTGSYDSLIVRLVVIWPVATDRQCLLRSSFTIARLGLFFTIGWRSYVNLHDNLCAHTFWLVVGMFIVNKLSKRGVDNAWNVIN